MERGQLAAYPAVLAPARGEVVADDHPPVVRAGAVETAQRPEVGRPAAGRAARAGVPRVY